MPQQLAIEGGVAVIAAGPPTWPLEDTDVREALLSAYLDGSWGRYHGPHCQRLCEQLAALHGIRHVTLCCSGTFAVELALRALRVSSGDEVVLTAYDFAGNFRCIESVGARPVLVDIEPSGGLAPSSFEEAIGPRTKAAIVSHLHSGLANMPEICNIARRHGVRVVEDACQAPGAIVADRVAGGWGDVGVLSFGGSKLLTAGRGGAILTNEDDIQQRTKIYCERGNHAFPLSELQAAVLVPQLTKLDARNQLRHNNARRLLDSLHTSLLRPLGFEVNGQASYYKLAFWLDRSGSPDVSREQLVAALRAEGLDVGVGFRGFTKRGSSRCRRIGPLDQSTTAANDIILLHHPALLQSTEELDAVSEAFLKVAEHYKNEKNA